MSTPLPSCQLVHLRHPGFVELVAASGDTERRWTTPDGDVVELRRIDGPSPFAGARGSQALAEEVERMATAEGGDWVELALTELAGRPAVRALLKHPQGDGGTRYTGLFVLPFVPFSFELRVACPERGEPGLREQRLLNQLLGSGQGWSFGEGGRIEVEDWDPENSRYDELFPDHPASRARRAMAELARTLSMDVEMVAWASAPMQTGA
ncbi:MAG: hypothetical protein H6741_19400 [Alphaproteobacteria bacterium]|nr:hypothetical protein [Alphaproteobacteria bacterium]